LLAGRLGMKWERYNKHAHTLPEYVCPITQFPLSKYFEDLHCEMRTTSLRTNQLPVIELTATNARCAVSREPSLPTAQWRNQINQLQHEETRRDVSAVSQIQEVGHISAEFWTRHLQVPSPLSGYSESITSRRQVIRSSNSAGKVG
jgi:hypothetical protein